MCLQDVHEGMTNNHRTVFTQSLAQGHTLDKLTACFDSILLMFTSLGNIYRWSTNELWFSDWRDTSSLHPSADDDVLRVTCSGSGISTSEILLQRILSGISNTQSGALCTTEDRAHQRENLVHRAKQWFLEKRKRTCRFFFLFVKWLNQSFDKYSFDRNRRREARCCCWRKHDQWQLEYRRLFENWIISLRRWRRCQR